MSDLRKIYSSVLYPIYHLLSQTAPPSVHSLPFLQVKLKSMKTPFSRNTEQSCHCIKSFKECLLQRETLLSQREDQEGKAPDIRSLFNARPQMLFDSKI